MVTILFDFTIFKLAHKHLPLIPIYSDSCSDSSFYKDGWPAVWGTRQQPERSPVCSRDVQAGSTEERAAGLLLFNWFLSRHLWEQMSVRHAVGSQGWYNLGLLAGEGFRLPMSILIELGLPQLYLADNSSLLSTLYMRWVFKVSDDCFNYTSVRKIIHSFLQIDAETQEMQTRFYLAALPSTMSICSLSRKTMELLLRWMWYLFDFLVFLILTVMIQYKALIRKCGSVRLGMLLLYSVEYERDKVKKPTFLHEL